MKSPILIAGGNSGIGARLVDALSRAGQPLICACRHPDQIAASDLVKAQGFDATDETATLDLPDSLDGLVYCPGTIDLKPFHRFTDKDFQRDLEVNLLGAIRLIRLALPALKNASSEAPGIVLFSTVAVQTGMPFHSSVAAAKGAVEGLAKSLAAELAPRIRVNVIAPSLTDTPLAERLLGSEEKNQNARQRHPLKQIGDPEDIAAIAAFLLGEQARFMTGQVIGVDGGLSTLKTF